MTDAFIERVERYITDWVKDMSGKQREAEIAKRWESLCFMWNNPQAFVDHPEVKEYYGKMNIYEPEYIVRTFVGKGSPSIPHITWIHEIKPISEIKEIYSYEFVE